MNKIKGILGVVFTAIGTGLLIEYGRWCGQNEIGNCVAIAASKWPDKTLGEFAKEAYEEGSKD